VARGEHLTNGGATIAVGGFANPPRSSVRWRDIGPGMSDALVRTLINRNGIDARRNSALAREAELLLSGSPDQRAARLEKLNAGRPDVRFVVTGRVTDFHHAGDLPKEARRRGLLGGSREAIVALQYDVIDLRTGRIIATDHVYGTGRTSRTPIRDVYANVAFGSYAFWNTPLGAASERVIRQTAAALARLEPAEGGEIQVVRQLGPRKVVLSGGSWPKHAAGGEYFLCTRDESTGRLQAVLDRDTGEPIRARIASGGGSAPTALLVGLKPLEVSLRGAVLTRTLPAPAEPEPGEEAAVTQAAAAQ
jgi:curli biogenesis system outer membrane secretion channel CsgG